jgi:glycosyltransferase involved in cell wall biosynthesis
MRIGVVTESFLPQMNGVVRMVLELLAYLRQHGHQALVFAPGDGPTEVEGFPVRRVKGLPFPPYPQVMLAPFSLWMYHDFQRFQPDVIHLASPFLLGMQGVVVGQALNVPVMGHFQTDVPRYAQAYHLGALADLATRYLVQLHNRCTVTFCPTPSYAAMLRQWGIRRIEVLGRGVDTALFHSGRRSPATRARYGLAEWERVLLYVGRLSTEKNLDRLVETAEALPDCRLVIVGDGPERATLATRLPASAVLTGFLHGVDLAAVYATADLFVFPSLTETFGQVVQEAMASGLPVVAMRASGVPDIVRHGVTGVLREPDDHAGWLGAIDLLLASPHLRREMGARARHQVEGCTWTGIFDRLIARYALATEQGEVPNVAISAR